jgi:hypothetical protein
MQMIRLGPIAAALTLAAISIPAQTNNTKSDFTLALPDHKGQLRWSAPGYKIIENSAKPNGREIGVRGRDGSGRVTLLGFLFLFPELAPLTSAKCRDGVLDPAKKSNPTLKVLQSSELTRPGGPPISLVDFTTQAKDGTTEYRVRGFVATGDICGDLEFYSTKPIEAQDVDLKMILSSYLLDESHAPTVSDIFLYAEILFRKQMFKAAAPLFEAALARVTVDGAPFPSVKTARRVITDQAGMSYGMSGDIGRARAIFEKAIALDSDYPMYYYNLACADAEEKKLGQARLHLQAAFARKANMISGEPMPIPTKDDSFLPYREDKDFWTFLEHLETSR